MSRYVLRRLDNIICTAEAAETWRLPRVGSSISVSHDLAHYVGFVDTIMGTFGILLLSEVLLAGVFFWLSCYYCDAMRWRLMFLDG